MRPALFWDITQCRVACRLDQYLFLKVEPTGFPETSVRNYHCILRNIPEQRRSQDRKYMHNVPEAHLDLYCLVRSHRAVPFIPLLSQILFYTVVLMRILVAARSKAKVCGRSLAWEWMCLVRVVCCQGEVSVTGRSFVERNPTECVCVCVCVSLSVIRCNSNPPHLTMSRQKEVRLRKEEKNCADLKECYYYYLGLFLYFLEERIFTYLH